MVLLLLHAHTDTVAVYPAQDRQPDIVSSHSKSGAKLIIYISSFQTHIHFPQRENCTFDSKSIFSIIYDHVENQNLILQVSK